MPDRQSDSAVLRVDGTDVTVLVRHNARAWRYNLRLDRRRGDFVLTVPAGGSRWKGLEFVASQKAWISTRLDRASRRVAFEDGATIPFRGERHVIRATGRMRGTVEIDEATDPPAILLPGAPAHHARRLTDWLKACARADLEPAVARHAATLEVLPKRIMVRDQVSRWGSCSARGTLSFSWRLILAPPMVLGYLAAHEVAHLREMNHSPRYWALLRNACPATDTAEAWLKNEGKDLHSYG